MVVKYLAQLPVLMFYDTCLKNLSGLYILVKNQMAKLVNQSRSSKRPEWVQLEGKKICHFLLRLSIIVQQLQALNNERFEIETKASVISLLVTPKTYV